MITDVLSTLVTVAQKIYEQVQLAKANQSQCQLLQTRIQIVIAAVKGLEKIPKADQYRPGLLELNKSLQEALKLVTKFTEEKSWFKKVLKAGISEGEFKAVNEKLQKCMENLNLGLAAQQIVSRDQDAKAQKEDFENIQKKLDTILRLNQEANKALQKLQFDQGENQAILLRQFASMKARLTDKASKPLIDKHLQIPYYQLRFNQAIGKGAFGNVYVGQFRKQNVAIKSIESSLSKEDQEQFVRELQIMNRLHSPHIVQLYGACLEPERLCLVMEYMEQGSLYAVLGKSPLDPSQQKGIALSIAKGLCYLHSQSMVHCDLKSANVLLNAKGEAKIADFGLSKASTQSIKGISLTSQAIEWQAPECLSTHPKFTPESDIYAFGVILYEIVTGKRPFAEIQKQNTKEIIKKVLAGQRDPIPANVAPLYRELIQGCWQTNPRQRPSLETIIEKLEAFTPDLVATIKINRPAPSGAKPEVGAIEPLADKKQKADRNPSANVNVNANANANASANATASPSPMLSLFKAVDVDKDSNKTNAEDEYQKGMRFEKAKQYDEAFKAYSTAVKLGHIKAHTNLGFFHLQGWGGAIKDAKKAFEYFSISANKGHPRAMINLAALYQYGQGVTKDLTKAVGWYDKAAALGDENAKTASIKLQSNLQTVRRAPA